MQKHTVPFPSGTGSTVHVDSRAVSLPPHEVLGAAITELHRTGRLNRSVQPLVEAMTLFTGFVEKRLRLPSLDEIRPQHIRLFVQLPTAPRPGRDRTAESIRRIRREGARLLLDMAAQLELVSGHPWLET